MSPPRVTSKPTGAAEPTWPRRCSSHTLTSPPLCTRQEEPTSMAVNLGRFHDQGFRSSNSKRSGSAKVSAFPSLDMVPLMATMVDHVDMSRDYVVTKSIWHLSDAALKSVYTFYAMFTAWGVCFFASMKDPFYDSDTYRAMEPCTGTTTSKRELEEAGREEQLTQ